jgi:hypothetical protein
MKKYYDFSKGERGKFFKKDVELRVPVYLDAESIEFVSAIARKRRKDVSSIVNQLIHKEMVASHTAKS